MAWWKFLALSIILASESQCRTPRIINGKDANIEDFPYQASIRSHDFHICGGTIISEKHVLTAGHCFFHHFQVPYSELTVNTGTSRRNETGFVYKIDEIIIHPNYYGNSSRAINDIAIIKLNKIIVFNMYQQKLNLPRQDFIIGMTVNLTGWGFKQQHPTVRPNQLQVMETTLISTERCLRRTSSKNWDIQDTEICTRNTLETGLCDGDSGSPIAANGEIIGIASWTTGYLCGYSATDVYTNVYKFKNFISQHTSNFYYPLKNEETKYRFIRSVSK